MRKTKIVALLMMAVCTLTALTGCGNLQYNNEINKMDVWENDITNAIPQKNIGLIIDDFLNTESPLEKTKKVAVFGYNGCKAEMLHALNKETINGVVDPWLSGINMIRAYWGHVYLSFAGGESKETKQDTSSGPSWASITTGVWADKHKVTSDAKVKSNDYNSFMLNAAEGENDLNIKYKSTCISSDANDFAVTFNNEVEYVRNKVGVNKTDVSDNEKLKNYLNAISDSTKGTNIDMEYKLVDNDEEVFNKYLDCVTPGSENERDIIFGVFDDIDKAGKQVGYNITASTMIDNKIIYNYHDAFKSVEEKVFSIIKEIFYRPSFSDEDWLIILTSGNGGLNKSTGGQSMEERTTWIVCNKEINEKYFSKNYNGKKDLG